MTNFQGDFAQLHLHYQELIMQVLFTNNLFTDNIHEDRAHIKNKLCICCLQYL